MVFSEEKTKGKTNISLGRFFPKVFSLVFGKKKSIICGDDEKRTFLRIFFCIFGKKKSLYGCLKYQKEMKPIGEKKKL